MRHTCRWPPRASWPYGDAAAQRAYALSTGCRACVLDLPANHMQRAGMTTWIRVLVAMLALLPVMAVLDVVAWLDES